MQYWFLNQQLLCLVIFTNIVITRAITECCGSCSGCAAVGLSMVNCCSFLLEKVTVFREVILRITSFKQVHCSRDLPTKHIFIVLMII